MIYVLLDNFAIRVHEAHKPVLRAIPFALERNGHIFAINDIAKKRGVRVGESVQKVRLRVYGVVIKKEHEKRIADFSDAFYRILSTETRIIGPDRPAGAFIEFPRNESIFDPKDKTEALKKIIKRELEIPVKIGIASNKVTAKLAAEIASADETITIQAGHEKKFISSLPISSLPGLGNRTALLLSAFGLTTIGSFAELPTSEAIRLFGKQGLQLHQIAQGIDNQALETPSRLTSISRSYQLPYPTTNIPHLISIGTFISYQLINQLKENELCHKTISVRLFGQDKRIYTKQQSKQIHSDEVVAQISQLIKEAFSKSKCKIYKVAIQIAVEKTVCYTKSDSNPRSPDRAKRERAMPFFLFSPNVSRGSV